MSVRTTGRFGRFLEGLRGVFRRKGEAAAREIGEKERPVPQTEAEEALHVAMGWAEPDGEDSLKVVRRAAREALEEA